MLRSTAVLVVLFLALPSAPACTFCGGNLRTKQTLRMHYAAAKAVYFGQLKNPRFDPRTDEGSTDLHITTVLKDDPARANRAVITLPRYLPVIGNTPGDYIAFCNVTNGQLDQAYGIPASPTVVDYLKGATVLAETDSAAKLGFFFTHLDAKDATIAADAFFEFARASDTEILKAREKFDAAKLRRLLADPATPVERLGVFAFLLGTCGGATDASFLAEMLTPNPLPERAEAAFGGLLAGYILLDGKSGWSFAAAVLGDPKRGFGVRLSAVETVRFLQSIRGPECKADVLKCCAALLPSGDLADQAVEDLRRWGCWDLTDDVLSQFGKPTHAAPIVRRAIVRYAITCPDAKAKAFLADVRQSDPKLVADVEAALKLYDQIVPKSK
jgi:hypothetical protein